MMIILTTFIAAFIFSFIGSIPPGTLNLTAIQLGLEHRINTAWRFSLAAAAIEIPYGWIAIEFESFLTASTGISEYFKLIAGIVMLALGGLNLFTLKKTTRLKERFNASGFRRGLILSILNPMALPFWIAMTAYLKSTGWVMLSSTAEKISYLLGVAGGALILLILMAYSAKKVIAQFEGNTALKKIPGITLLLLGCYAILAHFI
jgi:threonine/homoserine/homoserine lactone efflux protein